MITQILDANFEQALIDLGYGSGPTNGSVLTANINTITKLDISDKNITDLTGIEAFTSLTILRCAENKLTSLDVSQNTILGKLYCVKNKLISLDVSLNTGSDELYCYSNKLITLDVTQNSGLEWLYCNIMN